DEYGPAAFFAGNVVPFENTGEEQHHHAKQRGYGDIDSIVAAPYPEVTDSQEDCEQDPLCTAHWAHAAQLARGEFAGFRSVAQFRRVQLHRDPWDYKQAQQSWDDRGADPAEWREFVAGLHRLVASKKVAHLSGHEHCRRDADRLVDCDHE